MGKKSKNGGGGGGEKKATTTEVVLTVAMHCKCNGCKDKIRNGVKELALVPGVEAVDKSAVESKGEVRLVVVAATAKPDKLKDRLHRVTGKKVDLLVITPPKPAAAADDDDKAAAAEAVAALIRQAQAQAQAGVHVVPGAWAGGAVAYPAWGMQQPEGGYYYSPSTYPAGGLVYPYAAAYPPPGQQLLGNGGGGVVSPWYTHGY
uniref:HMA domain-containing protein n=1 Tax=Oryza meridionalis TaxID=40149 RepID=A0A0E0CT51_9ORYZ